MSVAKILWEQILTVFLSVVLTTWTATQSRHGDLAFGGTSGRTVGRAGLPVNLCACARAGGGRTL